MDKLAWVTLPLLLALAALALAWARGRLPSRLALNVASSLLLLVYLGVTAGLGIFWVANQHLPVFDWHYLFGYATVLLVLLHLGFNFRMVWNYLAGRRRPRRAQATDGAPDAARRRVLTTALAVAAGLGAGYFLGLRHGRTELRIDGGPAAGSRAAGAGPRAVVEQFHAFTAHTRGGLLRRSPSAGWGGRPEPFKAYPDVARRALPSPALAPGDGVQLATLGALLWHAAGVSDRQGVIPFRTSPSSGALFATELYLLVREVPDVAPGTWHYDADGHTLARLQAQQPDAGLFEGTDLLPGAVAWLVATAVFARTERKYGDRAYRYVLADLGHTLENVRAIAPALGMRAHFARRFDESPVARALALDEREEGVLALVALHGAQVGARRPTLLHSLPDWRPSPDWHPAPQVEAAGLTEAVHRATSLRAVPGSPGLPDGPAGGVVAATAGGRGDGEALALPEPFVPARSVASVIARRRSVRRYGSRPLGVRALATVLDAMLRRPAPTFSAALRLYVLTPAVDDLPAAAWRYDPGRHVLLRRGVAVDDLRARARRAALDQDTIGGAAAVFVLAIDRATYQADIHGPGRGYRHAFLEAGLAGERLYLAAGALGLGACAVGAFYDDEASALVGVDARHEWVVHFAALGVPA